MTARSLELRPATDADAVPICEFLNACTLVHQGIARSSPPDLVARLHLEGADPRFDSFVALDRGSIVGFAHIWAHGSDEVKLFGRTHPEARGRGVGSRLLSLCDRRAEELRPSARRTTTTWAADAAAPEVVRRQGYRPVRYFVTMEIDGGSVSEEDPPWPPEVERARLSELPDLSSALYVAWRDAFAGHWGTQAESEAEFWAERRDSKLGSAFPFDPALWLLALDRGAVVGFCLCELGVSDGETIGRVAEVGVVQSHRGSGIGSALLQDGFLELRGLGATRIVLDVDAENATSALRLYEKAGMTARPAFTVWEKAPA